MPQAVKRHPADAFLHQPGLSSGPSSVLSHKSLLRYITIRDRDNTRNPGRQFKILAVY